MRGFSLGVWTIGLMGSLAGGAHAADGGTSPDGATGSAPREATDAGRSPSERADLLFREGRALVARGEVFAGCAKFRESLALERTAGVLLNLGDCEERRGHFVEAHDFYVAAKSALRADDPLKARREAFADAAIARMLQLVARVTVRVTGAPECLASVLCNGAEVPVQSLGKPLLFAPAAIRCVAEPKPTCKGSHDQRSVVAGASVSIDLVVEPARVAPGPSSSVPAPMPPIPSRGPTWTPGLVVGSIGIGGLVVGILTGIAAMQLADEYRAHCNSLGQCDDAGLSAARQGKAMSIASPIGFGIGAIGMGLGAYLLIKGARPAPAWLTPQVGQGYVGLSVGRPF